MKAERVYISKGVTGYVVLCDDNQYHTTSNAFKILGTLDTNYVQQRMNRGITDITETSEGRIILQTINQEGK